MKFLEVLENTLKQDKRFIGEDGRLLKSVIYDAAMGADKQLLELLISNETLKQHFFVDVNGTLVFDKVKFTWVVESRKFLSDSYTRFKNKIGLADRDGKLLSQSSDVVLVWPYKDCVLEGGQTKEDQKRDEIFYNEILAPDQVSRLRNPKVFTNAKRISERGTEEISEFDEKDNLIIKGNNLLVLSSICERYRNQVKGIFIDPPYYFYRHKSDDAFKYNSNFKLSTWLTFMKNRIEIAKDLLSEDGILTLTIGIDGYAHLKLLIDEIFEVDKYPRRYIGTITWRKTDNQSNIGDFANVIDYILLYRKNKDTKLNKLPLSEKAIQEYSYEDDIGGKYRRANLLDLTRGRHYYEVKTPDGDIIDGPWMISKEEFEELARNDGIHWPSKGKQIPYGKTYLKETLEKGQIANDFWNTEFGTNQRSADEIKELFGGRVFEYAKPERLLMNIISLISGKGDLILDFFLGTGTTAAVALKMGRRFIGIEQMDYIETITVPRLQKVIKGEQGGISKDVNWQGGGSFVYCELKELNATLMSALQEASSSEEVQHILYKAIDEGRLIPSVMPKDLRAYKDEFAKLPIDQQKHLVMELLDKNKLYVNLCDMDDEDMGITDQEKAFTRSFYRLEEKGGM